MATLVLSTEQKKINRSFFSSFKSFGLTKVSVASQVLLLAVADTP